MLSRSSSVALGFAFLLQFASNSCLAENWPQWRGPHFNGSTTESDLPTSWSKTENILWSADLPGASASTPAIWDDHIFVASDDPDGKKIVAICIDRKTGKLIWSHDIAPGIRRDSRSTFSAPSPCTDGKVAVFFSSTGDLVAYDFDGTEKWRRNVEQDYGEFAFQWTFSTSPVIYDNKLILQVLQRDTAVNGRGFEDKMNESYILAMDPQTGKTLWRHVRPSQAKAESREAFTTPVIYKSGDQAQLLVIGGDDLTGHDLETGKELWRWGTWNPTRIGHWRHVPSPVAGGDTVLVCAPKKDPIYAIKLGRSGQLSADDVAWVSSDDREVSSDVPTPAYYDGDFFVLSDVRKSLSRVDPKTGERRWTTRMQGKKFEASPLAADGKLYLINFDGNVSVVDTKTGELINEIAMDEPRDEPVRSSIIAAGGNLFIRTTEKLYCVGK